MELKKYKVCPSCGEHNRPTSLECRKCETDLTGIRVVDTDVDLQAAKTEGGKTSAVCDVVNGGDLLVRVCEECGAENAPQARKCKRCGEDISDILPSTSTAKQEKRFAYKLVAVGDSYSTVINNPLCIVGRESELREYLGTKMYVSRQHAEFTVVAGKVFVKNLSSTNKTFVNNTEIPNESPTALAYGDEIGLGGKVISGERQSNAAYFVLREQP